MAEIRCRRRRGESKKLHKITYHFSPSAPPPGAMSLLKEARLRRSAEEDVTRTNRSQTADLGIHKIRATTPGKGMLSLFLRPSSPTTFENVLRCAAECQS